MTRVDPFLLALLATLAVASVLPPRGAAVPAFHVLATAVIALMFFLQGARLSRRAVLAGLGHWRLHLLILGCTFVLFPVLGLLLHALLPGLLTPTLWLGVLFVCVLPSTVQSSIAFTSIAGGNVPAAVCSATVSNLLGVVLTPLLVGVVLAGAVHAQPIPARAVGDIGAQLLLPFLLGQALQPRIGGFVRQHRVLATLADRGSILVVVYSAFGEAVAQGLWGRLPPQQLLVVCGVDALLLGAVLAATGGGARRLGFDRGDEAAILFCGSKKTLASGVPMAGVLFPPAVVGEVVLPLIVFPRRQLFVCAAIARRYARGAVAAGEGGGDAGPARP